MSTKCRDLEEEPFGEHDAKTNAEINRDENTILKRITFRIEAVRIDVVILKAISEVQFNPFQTALVGWSRDEMICDGMV